MRPIHWHRYPFVFLVISLITGIVASEQVTFISSSLILYVLAGLLILMICLAKLKGGLGFVMTTFLFLFLTGVYIQRPNTPTFISGENYVLKGRLEQYVAPDKAIISDGSFRVHVQFKDTIRFIPGDSLVCHVKLEALSSTANVYEFDYNKYLRQQDIHARGVLLSYPTKIGHSEDLYSRCHTIQRCLRQKLHRIIPDSTTCHLLSALCLGDRTELSPDTKQLFQDTGTIHLLAISGLHMGAIYVLLLYVLRFFRLYHSRYKLILIPLIWFIAGITGLSPSACRAATILSMITIGEVFYQNPIPLNFVAASAFLTLLVKPELIYSLSFQMSYAAYIGITLIFPLINVKSKKISPIVSKMYALLCVSFSAQIATLPIIAYYFNTINLNSILINLVAVPVATVVLYGGIILLVIPSFIGYYLGYAVTGITYLLVYSLRLYSAVTVNLKGVYPTGWHVALLYAIGILVIIYLITRKRRTLYVLCGTVGIFVVFVYGYSSHLQNKQEIVIFNRYRHSTILLNQKGYCFYLKNTDDVATRPNAYIEANHLCLLPVHEEFISPQISYTGNRLCTRGDTIVIADTKHNELPETGTLIITENVYPVKKSETSLRRVILDQSNSPGCIRAWENFCEHENIPLLKTSSTGSIIIPLK